MRLAGKARIWEDAHSWEAAVTTKDGKNIWGLMSYSTMTECVKAGRVGPVDETSEQIHEVSA